MKDALQSAFKEHYHLNQTLENTRQEAEDLKKLTHSLAGENLSLALQKVSKHIIYEADRAHSSPWSHSRLWNTCQICAEYISGFSPWLFACADPVYFDCGPTAPYPTELLTPIQPLGGQWLQWAFHWCLGWNLPANNWALCWLWFVKKNKFWAGKIPNHPHPRWWQ